jgi:hypothetical protein
VSAIECLATIEFVLDRLFHNAETRPQLPGIPKSKNQQCARVWERPVRRSARPATARGACSTARATSTRRRYPPPLNCLTFWCRNSSRASRSSSGSIRESASLLVLPCSDAKYRRYRTTVGSRSSVGCWNSTPMHANARRGPVRMSQPQIRTVPWALSNKCVKMANKVVLSAPFGPYRTAKSPGRTVKLTLFHANCYPQLKQRSSTSRAGRLLAERGVIG